jgi:hypothetical protein
MWFGRKKTLTQLRADLDKAEIEARSVEEIKDLHQSIARLTFRAGEIRVAQMINGRHLIDGLDAVEELIADQDRRLGDALAKVRAMTTRHPIGGPLGGSTSPEPQRNVVRPPESVEYDAAPTTIRAAVERILQTAPAAMKGGQIYAIIKASWPTIPMKPAQGNKTFPSGVGTAMTTLHKAGKIRRIPKTSTWEWIR